MSLIHNSVVKIGCSGSDMAAPLHFRSSVDLLAVKHNRKCQVQRAVHFYSFFSEGSYIKASHGSAINLRLSMEMKIGYCGSAQLHFSSNLTLVEVNQVTSSREHESDGSFM